MDIALSIFLYVSKYRYQSSSPGAIARLNSIYLIQWSSYLLMSTQEAHDDERAATLQCNECLAFVHTHKIYSKLDILVHTRVSISQRNASCYRKCTYNSTKCNMYLISITWKTDFIIHGIWFGVLVWRVFFLSSHFSVFFCTWTLTYSLWLLLLSLSVYMKLTWQCYE